jgi:uncharacterized protein (DUF1800 family)
MLQPQKFRFSILSVLLVAALLAPVSSAAAQTEPELPSPSLPEASLPVPGLTERQKVIHLLSRLSYAPTAQTVAYVQSIGIERWLEDQLQARLPARRGLSSALAVLPAMDFEPADAVAWVRGDHLAADVQPGAKAQAAAEKRRAERKRYQQIRAQLQTSILMRAVASDRQAEEVLADFWRNHFNVNLAKGQKISLVMPQWEREVIRGYLWGDFYSMLEATAKHPAMLYYLDQAQSRRRFSQTELDAIHRRVLKRSGDQKRADQAVARAAQSAPNENYARELMELHTLGVDRVYQQTDVITVADALTGWTIAQPNSANGDNIAFQYAAGRHTRGDKQLFGDPLPESDPSTPAQGEAILARLAHHEMTAETVARKMVHYLVDDQAPENLVQQIATEFHQNGGDLATLVRSIVTSPEFFAPEHYRAKIKTPWEFVVSSLRVSESRLTNPRQVLAALRAMGQPLYQCDVPTGWSDSADAWLDPGAMALRWEFASRLASGKMGGVKIPARFYARHFRGVAPEQWAQRMVEQVIPGGVGERTQNALDQVLRDYLSQKKVRKQGPKLLDIGPELLALVLGSPEFQQQ